MRLRSLTYDELVSKGVTPKFSRILTDPGSYHPDLSIEIGKTDWDYFIPAGVTDVVPLWDSNADSFVRWMRNGEIEYVWLFHDDPKWILIAKSEQGIMAKLWINWCEFQESEDEPRRFADAIGFRHWQQALKMWEDDYDSFNRWRESLED